MSKLIENIKRLAAMIKGETQSGGNTAVRVGGLFEDISSELELKYDRTESDRIMSDHDTSDVSHQNVQDKINESIENLDQKQTDALAEHAETLTIHKTSEQIRGEIVDADIPVTLARVADVDAKDAVILSDAKKYANDHVTMLSNDVYHKAESYNRTEIDNKDAAVLNNSKEYVTARIAEIVGGSPAALDTLYEIARAMNNDPNFGTSVIAMINGKSDLIHNHTKSQITDFPASLPANGGNADTVDGKHAAAFQPAGNYAAGTHNHTKSQITDFPASLPANGGNADTVDGLHANSFARASLGISFGGTSGDITTEEFLTMLNGYGAFNQPCWSSRGSWFYAGNKIISDTGTGRIYLAGASVEVISDSTIRVTIRITTAASTPGAEPKRVFVYTKNETTTAWIKLANSTDIPTSLPAADVHAWAKAPTKPTYTAAEVGAATSAHNHAGVYQPVGSYAAATHNHAASQITEQANKRFMTDAERTKLAGLTPSVGVTAWATVKMTGGSGSVTASGGAQMTINWPSASSACTISSDIDFTKHAVIITPHYAGSVLPVSVQVNKSNGFMVVAIRESGGVDEYKKVGFDIVVI